MAESRSLRFAQAPLSTPPNAPPSTYLPMSADSSRALYSDASLLFHQYSWTDSIKAFRSLLRRSPGRHIPLSQIWCNIGIIRCHLGEYALAAEAFDRALADERDLAIAWYCLAMSLFQLGDYRKAERRYKRCLDCIPPDSFAVDYEHRGLDFCLGRVRVEWNVKLCMLWKLHKQVHAEEPQPWCLNRLPAGLIFEHTKPIDSDRNLGGEPTTGSESSIPSRGRSFSNTQSTLNGIRAVLKKPQFRRSKSPPFLILERLDSLAIMHLGSLQEAMTKTRGRVEEWNTAANGST